MFALIFFKRYVIVFILTFILTTLSVRFMVKIELNLKFSFIRSGYTRVSPKTCPFDLNFSEQFRIYFFHNKAFQNKALDVVVEIALGIIWNCTRFGTKTRYQNIWKIVISKLTHITCNIGFYKNSKLAWKLAYWLSRFVRVRVSWYRLYARDQKNIPMWSKFLTVNFFAQTQQHKILKIKAFPKGLLFMRHLILSVAKKYAHVVQIRSP